MIRFSEFKHKAVCRLSFQILIFRQTEAVIAFEDQTVTGKLKAEIILIIDSGWY